jgi:hypothetical protein
MDAIALWQAGVRETVACMGTALTLEQLSAAARIAGTKNGKCHTQLAQKGYIEQLLNAKIYLCYCAKAALFFVWTMMMLESMLLNACVAGRFFLQ